MHFIDGRRVTRQVETMPVLDPSTGLHLADIACGTAEDIDQAVHAARRAFENEWGSRTATERGRLLTALASRIAANTAELTSLEASGTGKPMSQAKADIATAFRYFEYYGAAADKVHGETIPYLNGYAVSITHEPYGVTGHILPWNYPAQMFGRSLAPSLAAGNTVVLKPSEEACLTPLRMAELATECGFPDGVINVVTGRGEVAGAALCAHPGIGFISFTGSPEVGRIVQRTAADHYIACTLELGGKSPQIVFEDADFDVAAESICRAIVQNAGQTCSAGSRVLVQRSVFDSFLQLLATRFSSLRAGTPEMDLDCGPMISVAQRQRVQGYVDSALLDGIPMMAQGMIAKGVPASGFYIRPVLFGPVPCDHPLAREEVFGPVLAAMPFEDEADAVRLANATDYGLVVGVWTRDGGRQQRLARRVRAGQVFVNAYGAGAGVELPFGGVRKSGHGREKGLQAIHEFMTQKTIVHKYE